MGGGAVSPSPKGRSRFQGGSMELFGNKTIPIGKTVIVSVQEYGAISAINYGAPPPAVGVVPITAFAIPLDHLVVCKLKGRQHGIIHFPSVFLKMPFVCQHICPYRKIYTKGPARHIKLVGAIIPGFCGPVIPAVPVPI